MSIGMIIYILIIGLVLASIILPQIQRLRDEE